jgi:hypothetical protein
MSAGCTHAECLEYTLSLPTPRIGIGVTDAMSIFLLGLRFALKFDMLGKEDDEEVWFIRLDQSISVVRIFRVGFVRSSSSMGF